MPRVLSCEIRQPLSSSVSKDRDLRDDIFFAMAEHKIPVLTMELEELTLENIFLSLTGGEGTVSDETEDEENETEEKEDTEE